MYRLLVIVALAFIIPATADANPGKSSIKQVEVTNFPDPQNVTGAVEVLNLPAVQDVNVVNAPPAPTACASRFQLVGFTSATYTGDTGVLGFTRGCQAEFGLSRMCTSEEVVETVDVPNVATSDPAWVRPTFEPVSAGPGGISASRVVADVSGIHADFPRELSCEGWHSSGTGLAVDGDGRFGKLSCTNAPRPLACCAPVP